MGERIFDVMCKKNTQKKTSFFAEKMFENLVSRSMFPSVLPYIKCSGYRKNNEN